MSDEAPTTVRRLARFGLTTANADSLAVFFAGAFGFRRLEKRRVSGVEFETLMGKPGEAMCIALGLGDEFVELLQFDRPGAPYPEGASASDLAFQHLAIAVSDMNDAYQNLLNVSGWAAISRSGPQRLPASSGGVIAFKFRDPEGHPLELLAFPNGRSPACWSRRHGSGPCLGIDHSALNVSDSARSIAYYEALGLRRAAHSLNHGFAQQRLDGIPEPRVEVTALVPQQATPHVELLCYRSAAAGRRCRSLDDLRSNDIAATRLIFEADHELSLDQRAVRSRLLRDPDGHHLVIVASDRISS